MHKHFRFIKDLHCKAGVLPKGSELTVVGDRIYFNGGQIEPWYYDFFAQLIDMEMEKPNYLQERVIPFNKA